MTTLTTQIDTVFTPAASTFSVQLANGGAVMIRRRSTASAPWVDMTEIRGQGVVYVDNPVAGADYVLVATAGTPTVQADQ